ncbi:TonB-dependent receptor plug domain-containing protein [Flagellimonas algicola]|uniref:TonB-dependent receptor n=1 Tax=Flagellimonas algicola TaxID=2583815 RepID=A0ABY2WQ82_9FLAO|nr:TonB-dependent receptor plug domain-containing protein [Allomuricauda algicola]TMU56890.1 TonB-dependent receptor [Allomuricauda algicola]
MNKNYLRLCATFLVGNVLAAQEVQQDSTEVNQLQEVVVTDSRFALKRENSGKTVIKITSEELERNQGKTISQIINTKSGIEINGSRGRNGVILGNYVRGGRGRQVLVIIDGVQVSDPSSFSSEYDLRLLSTANIESIEIIKGAASTLYGTNAATAVINITSKKPSKAGIAANFQSSMGTNQTSEEQRNTIADFSNNAAINGTLKKFTYSANFSNTYTNGISAVITPENEEDSFSRINTNVRLGYQITNALDISVFGNHSKTEFEFDESFGFLDADYVFNTEQNRFGFSTNFKYGPGSIHANGAYSTYDSESISAFGGTFESHNYVADIYNKINFNNAFYTIVGLNYIKNEIVLDEEKNFTITDPYANVVYVSDFGLNVNAGARLNNHSEYGSNFIYNINPSYTIKTDSGYAKILGSYATSYITPSLNQLFGNFGPNPDLLPEDDRTIEGGLEYSITNKFRTSVLYFNRKEENFVFFDNTTFGFLNAENTIDAKGVEVELQWIPVDDLRFDANYTFTERQGDNAIRIPKHKLNVLAAYSFSKRTNASVAYAYTGERSDTDFSVFPSVDVPLEAFSLVDLYVGHELLPKKLKLFFNVDNLLNEDFQETLGFSTRGRNYRIGMNLNF